MITVPPTLPAPADTTLAPVLTVSPEETALTVSGPAATTPPPTTTS